MIAYDVGVAARTAEHHGDTGMHWRRSLCHDVRHCKAFNVKSTDARAAQSKYFMVLQVRLAHST